MKRKIAEAVAMIAIIVISILIMINAETVAGGVHSGIELCMTSVIPSLFAIMYISVILVECGAAQRIGRYLAPFCAALFDLPGEAGTAMLIAVTGGYPAGAKAVCGLYRRGEISMEEAGQMALFCFCSGPAFIIGSVGAIVGQRGAVILLAAQVMTVPIMGMLARIYPKIASDKLHEKAGGEEKCQAGARIIVSAAKQTCSAMLMICAFVILFCGVISLLDAIGAISAISHLLSCAGIPQQTAEMIVRMLPEVTTGCISAARAGLPAVAFALGFGGFAVHAQVLAVCSEIKLRYSRFLLMRVLQGCISAALTWCAMQLFPSAAAASAPAVQITSGGAAGSAALMVMCLMCIICMPRFNEE